jgi:thiamine biosynthesis lipoprotein
MNTATFAAIGTTATVVVPEPWQLDVAQSLLRNEIAAIDVACSRFRADSEITAVHRMAGREVMVSPVLAAALDLALRAARLTDGIVDPTVGQAVIDLGYDRDFGFVPTENPRPAAAPTPAPGWWRISVDAATRRVLLPRGITVDLGATAKAFAADRAATHIADAVGCGVLVNLGGDIAVAGPAPDGGWHIGIGDDHRGDTPHTVVRIGSGGIATSSTTWRRWRMAGRTVHHIVDPRTGDVPDPAWRTVSVAAGSCVDANTASTAAIVLGAKAPQWLAGVGLPARLVGEDGRVVTVAGWPEDGVPVVTRERVPA